MRKARKGRDYTALRDLGVRAVDDVFKMAAPLLREATDLKENMQVGWSSDIFMILNYTMKWDNSTEIVTVGLHSGPSLPTHHSESPQTLFNTYMFSISLLHIHVETSDVSRTCQIISVFFWDFLETVIADKLKAHIHVRLTEPQVSMYFLLWVYNLRACVWERMGG